MHSTEKLEDSFQATSLHLAFAEYEIPLRVSVGAVDAEAAMLETLVSVYDRERWVADIDVLGCLSRSNFFVSLSAQDSEGSLAISTSTMEAVLLGRIAGVSGHIRRHVHSDSQGNQELECTACYNLCLFAKRIPYGSITDNETFVHRLRPRSGRYA